MIKLTRKCKLDNELNSESKFNDNEKSIITSKSNESIFENTYN